MELKEETGCGGGPGVDGRVGSHWYWAGAGGAQLILGISSYRKGVAGDGRLMPLKAFAVATIFVGAAASAVVASVKSFGIHSEGEDLKKFKAIAEERQGFSKGVKEPSKQDSCRIRDNKKQRKRYVYVYSVRRASYIEYTPLCDHTFFDVTRWPPSHCDFEPII